MIEEIFKISRRSARWALLNLDKKSKNEAPTKCVFIIHVWSEFVFYAAEKLRMQHSDL